MKLLKIIFLTAVVTAMAVCGFVYRSALPHLVVWATTDYNIVLDDFKAADQGNPEAITKVGDLYYASEGYDKAAYYYQQAVDKKFTPAMIKLSKMYKDGIGVAQDKERANELLVQASMGGNLDAIKHIGDEIGDAFKKLTE